MSKTFYGIYSESDSTKGTNFGSKSNNGSKNTPSEEKTIDSSIPKKTVEIICPNCGEKNEKSSNFCIKCGLDFNKVSICPKCGNVSTLGKFCTDCGTPLKKFK